MFDQDSSSVVRSPIGLFAFRSNQMSKVYQHRSRNGGILEVAWSTGSLRKNSNRHCYWGVNTQSISATANEQARIEHAPNGSLLTYITVADASHLVLNIQRVHACLGFKFSGKVSNRPFRF